MKEQRVVLITGSSRGIGAVTAKKFASLGYHVIINYCTNTERALQLKEELESKYQIKVMAIKTDISNETEVKNMIEIIKQEFGKIDVLVNNAGIAIDTLFEDKTKENFMRTLEVNLYGTFLMSKLVGEMMIKQGDGNIINISSTNGMDTVYPESIDYDASKAGVISLTKNLSIQFAPYIKVNTICPGWVNTEMNQELAEDFVKREEEKILLKRFASPEEIANVIAFLASEEASYINNSIIRVDGGSMN